MFVAPTRKWVCDACRRCIFDSFRTARALTTTASRWQNVDEMHPGVIQLARKMAAQHKELEQKAAAMIEYTPQSIQIYKRISELENVANNLKSFEETQKNLEDLNEIIASSKDKDMISLAVEEIQQATSGLQTITMNLMSSLVPRHPQAHLPCIMEFKRGVGGDDAAIFAGDLFRMYQKFVTKKGWTWESLSYSPYEGMGDGIIDAVVAVSSPRGDDVYGTLRTEAGVHRVQRIPITENSGRIHTSAAAVMIFPQVQESELEDDPLNMDEVKVELMRARGAGGQHVNKTESAVRMTHIPTGISVSMQDSRSQHANRAAAILILRSRLVAKRDEERRDAARKLRNTQVTSNDRSDKIRTWNFNQNRVTDHRGFKFNDLKGCMEGDSLEELMSGVATVLQRMELEEAIALETQ